MKSQPANEIICHTIEHTEFKIGGEVSLTLPSRHPFDTSTHQRCWKPDLCSELYDQIVHVYSPEGQAELLQMNMNLLII